MTEALVRAAGWLRCPVCQSSLSYEAGSLRCPAGHSFDVAKQGYVNLLGKPPKNADTPDMVAARERFLAGGHYEFLAEAVAQRVQGEAVCEVGAGTGYYLSHAVSDSRFGLATDVSTAACRRAAKCHPRVAAVVADTWAGLPLRDHSFDTVLCVFAPRNAAEFARILRPAGRLIVVSPRQDHLTELRETAGLLDIEADKDERIVESLSESFRLVGRCVLCERLKLTSEQSRALVEMGPNAFHSAKLPSADTEATAAVTVWTWESQEARY